MSGRLIAVIALGLSIARWGEAGHRLIGTAAASALPPDMPAFFRSATDQLAYLNPEPDRWRDRVEKTLDPAADGAFTPDHYIDLERVPPGALRAPNRFAYLDSLRAAGVDAAGAGLLPFRILELTQRVREEFRLWRSTSDARTRGWIESRIVNDAGILGHYVADGSNPHHTTVNFDGWVGDNPKGYVTAHGFHARFESIYVQTHFVPGDPAMRVTDPPRVFDSLRPAILAYLRETNALVPRLYDLEKAAPFDSATTDAEHKRFTAERLVAGARMLRDLWWTAWVTSGAQGVDSIVARDIAARGGIEKIRALQTVRQTGFLTLGSHDTARLVVEHKVPHEMRMELTMAGKTLVRAFDGRTGWQVAPFGGDTTARRMTPDEQHNIAREADLAGPLVDYAIKGNAVELAGVERVGGRDAYKLKVTFPDGDAHYYYIDRESYLPVKWEGSRLENGKTVVYESYFRSYRDVGGVKLPARIESGTKGVASAPNVMVINDAVANPALDESRFAPPSGLK
jgi:hypothetical protein